MIDIARMIYRGFHDRFLVLLIIISTMFLFGVTSDSGSAATSPSEVHAGSEVEFPPYAFVDENGQIAGFSVDLIRAVTKAMGLPMKVTTGTWDAVWSDLVAGRIDVLPIVAKLPDRIPLVDFSLPHTETYDAFFIRKGNDPIQSIAQARGKEIVAMRSDAAHHALLEHNFQGQLILVDTIPQGLSLIASGKHDAFLCSKLIGTLASRQHGIKGLTAGSPIPDYKRVFSFAVKKGDAELLEKLNQGLLLIKANGEYQTIYDKWLTIEDPWQSHMKYLSPVISVTLAVVLIGGFWLVMLRRQVNKRTLELTEKNEMLQQIRNGLDRTFSERTRELSSLNATLLSEITENTRAKTELVRERNKAQQYLETVETIIVALDTNGCITMINRKGCQLLGYAEEDLLGKNWFLTCLPQPEGYEHVYPVFQQIIAGRLGSTEYFENAVVTRSGSQHIVAWHNALLRNDNGDIIGTLSSGDDITERKRSEEALRESEEKYRQIFDTATDAIFILDLNGNFIDVNKTAYTRLGYSKEEMLSLHISRLDPPEFASKIPERLAQISRFGQAVFESAHIRKDGSVMPVEVNSRLLDYEGRKVYFSVIRDITERKRAEDLLRENQRYLKTIIETAPT